VTELVLAATIGASAALAVWALRDLLAKRHRQDVGWLKHSIWRFTPDPIPAERYVAWYHAAAFAVLFLLLLFAPSIWVALLVWVLLLLAPRALIARAWGVRKKQIDGQLPAAVRQMSASVGSGLSLAQAIEHLAERAPDPIRTEFRLMANYWKRGADYSAIIEEAKRRLVLPNFDLFASALIVNQRMGGNITQTLDSLAGALESIDRMKRDVHAATSEGRTNIKVLALAPLIMLGLVALMDAEAVGLLFTSALGQIILTAAAALTATGTWWAWRIVHADV
jgi:tight adherence protein B